MNLEFEGMEDLLRNIEKLGDKGKQIEEKALNEGADHLVQKFKASNDFKDETGILRKSIGKSSVKNGHIEAGVGPEGFYGLFLEIGFYNKRVKRQIPPRPWMGPAFESSSPDVQRIMAGAVKRELGI